jgi:hypothetical protein
VRAGFFGNLPMESALRKYVLSLLALLVVIGAAVFALWESRGMGAVKFDTPYQAVILDNGQVYYGKVENLGTLFPVLTDVYYVERQVNEQTKEARNILVRRGNEWHAPDRMVVNANHVVLVEPVSPGSKLAQLIVELKTKNP